MGYARARQPTIPLINYGALASSIVSLLFATCVVLFNFEIEFQGWADSSEKDECEKELESESWRYLGFLYSWLVMAMHTLVIELILKKQTYIPMKYLNPVLLSYGVWTLFNLHHVSVYFFPRIECSIGRRDMDLIACPFGEDLCRLYLCMHIFAQVNDGMSSRVETLYDCWIANFFPQIEEDGRPKYAKSISEYFRNLFKVVARMVFYGGLSIIPLCLALSLKDYAMDGVFILYSVLIFAAIGMALFMEIIFPGLTDLLCALFGAVPQKSMYLCLLSTSVSEFWRERYNIWTSHYLKNSIQKPVLSVLIPRNKSNPGGKPPKHLMNKELAYFIALTLTMVVGGGFMHEARFFSQVYNEDLEQFVKEATFQTWPTSGLFGWWLLFYSYHTIVMAVEKFFRGLKVNPPDVVKHQLFMLFVLPFFGLVTLNYYYHSPTHFVLESPFKIAVTPLYERA